MFLCTCCCARSCTEEWDFSCLLLLSVQPRNVKLRLRCWCRQQRSLSALTCPVLACVTCPAACGALLLLLLFR